MARASGSSARARRVGASERPTSRRDEDIDFSDIPERSEKQLAAMKRVGRPPPGEAPRHKISIHVDDEVLDALRKEARRRGVGYQTLIHDVLAKPTAKWVAKGL